MGVGVEGGLDMMWVWEVGTGIGIGDRVTHHIIRMTSIIPSPLLSIEEFWLTQCHPSQCIKYINYHRFGPVAHRGDEFRHHCVYNFLLNPEHLGRVVLVDGGGNDQENLGSS